MAAPEASSTPARAPGPWQPMRPRWTPYLQTVFALTVHALGGPFEATPHVVLKVMSVAGGAEGVTVGQVRYHLRVCPRNTNVLRTNSPMPEKVQLSVCCGMAPPEAVHDLVCGSRLRAMPLLARQGMPVGSWREQRRGAAPARCPWCTRAAEPRQRSCWILAAAAAREPAAAAAAAVSAAAAAAATAGASSTGAPDAAAPRRPRQCSAPCGSLGRALPCAAGACAACERAGAGACSGVRPALKSGGGRAVPTRSCLRASSGQGAAQAPGRPPPCARRRVPTAGASTSSGWATPTRPSAAVSATFAGGTITTTAARGHACSTSACHPCRGSQQPRLLRWRACCCHPAPSAAVVHPGIVGPPPCAAGAGALPASAPARAHAAACAPRFKRWRPRRANTQLPARQQRPGRCSGAGPTAAVRAQACANCGSNDPKGKSWANNPDKAVGGCVCSSCEGYYRRTGRPRPRKCYERPPPLPRLTAAEAAAMARLSPPPHAVRGSGAPWRWRGAMPCIAVAGALPASVPAQAHAAACPLRLKRWRPRRAGMQLSARQQRPGRCTGAGPTAAVRVQTCSNCGSDEPTGHWVGNPDSAVGGRLCHSCYCYYHNHGRPRPLDAAAATAQLKAAHGVRLLPACHAPSPRQCCDCTLGLGALLCPQARCLQPCRCGRMQRH